MGHPAVGKGAGANARQVVGQGRGRSGGRWPCSRRLRLRRRPAASEAVTEPRPGPPVSRFAVYGPKPVIDAYTEIAAGYTLQHPDTKVNVQAVRRPREPPWRRYRKPSAKGDPPDVFLMDHDDLAGCSRE